MPTPEQLQEENERLRAELTSYKEAEQINKDKKGQFIKWLNNISSWFFLGSDLKQSIKKLVIEVRDKDKKLSNDTLGDVLAHGVWRFTRIGCFTIALALVPVSILITQTVLFYYQNQKIDIQNNLVEKQNEKIDAQNIRLDQQTNLQEAERRSSLVFLFSNIMDAIDRELKNSKNKQRNLTSPLTGRIIALSTRLKSYKYLTQGDTLTTIPLSPERGQLLINLVESHLDSITYNNIFIKANFEEADLREVNFSRANLRGTKLNKSNLSRADLSRADLSRADLSRANLNKSNLNKSNLSRVDLNGANLSGANLNGANLNGANLNGANLNGANLYKANLYKVDLGRANLDKANFIEVNLSGVDLSGVDLSGVNLSGVNLSGANLSGANLSGANLSGANLSEANLSGANLSEAKLYRVNLYEANLSGADLSRANLYKADLRGGYLSEVNFSGAKLNGIQLDSARTSSSNFLVELDDNINDSKELQEKYYITSNANSFMDGKIYFLIKRRTELR